MNKTIRRASVLTLLLVFALLIRATLGAVLQGRGTRGRQGKPAERDRDVRGAAREHHRGRPVDHRLAPTEGGDLAYKRTYDKGKLYAAVTGYALAGVRADAAGGGIYQDVLNGTDPRLKTVMDTITGTRAEPGNVVTTIDPAVQKAGFEGAGRDKGAAVAIDPKTGRSCRSCRPVVRPDVADRRQLRR
ncbi:hypothetical protein LV779_32450 [Streptomyces thinghirensis]|nr:hypothetical protein [Streptomyces thinghirensis]